MGTLVSFADLPYRETARGVRRAAITGGDMKEMSADVIQLAPGAKLTVQVAVTELELMLPARLVTDARRVSVPTRLLL